MIYQIIAIIILLAFYTSYFAKMFAQKRKGIQTDQMGKGKSGFVAFVEITLKTVTIIIPVAETASIILNTTVLPSAVRIMGCVLGTVGVFVFMLSVITMKDSWRAGVSETEKTELVTDGIYKISRNPAFLGFDLLYIGILLIFFNLPLCVLTLAGMIMFHLQIVNVEEDHLVCAFGESYVEYTKKVNRYFGRKINKKNSEK